MRRSGNRATRTGGDAARTGCYEGECRCESMIWLYRVFREAEAKRRKFWFFFFKQKTAYEITRYWSSDVCSSDLHHHLLRRHRESPRAAGFSDSLEEFDLPAVGIRTLMRRASTAPCAPDSG